MSYAPPPPVSQPPLSPPMKQQAAIPNPHMTTIPVQPLQESQETAQPRSHRLSKSIVLFVTNILAIALFYSLSAWFTNLITNSRILLIFSAGLLIANLINFIVVVVLRQQPLSKYIPILFSVVAALTLMLFFLVMDQSVSKGKILLNQEATTALFGSVGLFSGLGLGSTIMYALYGI